MNRSKAKSVRISPTKSSSVTGRVDAWLSIALFSISLSCYYFHWFRLTPSRHDSTLLALYTRDFLQENIFRLGPNPIVYIQALIFSVFGYSVASLQSIT